MIETRVNAAYRSLTKTKEELCGDDVQIRVDEKNFVLVLRMAWEAASRQTSWRPSPQPSSANS